MENENKKSFLLKIPSENYHKLKRIARKRGMSITSLINLIIFEYVNKNFDEEKQI